MAEQLPLGHGALALPPGFVARWGELQVQHKTIVVLSDIEVTSLHIVVVAKGSERIGARRDGDAAAAEQIWNAIFGRAS